jgi:hypothetical protein
LRSVIIINRSKNQLECSLKVREITCFSAGKNNTGGSDSFFDYLNSINFFKAEIETIIKLSKVLILRQKTEILEDIENIEENESNLKITDELRKYFNQGVKPLGSDESSIDIEELQRNISEGLYGRLTSLGIKHSGSSEKIFEVRKEIPLKLSEFLSLKENEPILGEISEEFLLWLKSSSEILTDWGKISYVEPDKIRIKTRKTKVT